MASEFDVMAVKRKIGNALPRLRDYRKIRVGFAEQFGSTPNVLFPQTFSEKIQRRKLFDRDPRMPLRADKIAVKDFVSSKLGASWVTPTIWYGDALPGRRDWPMPFVLKGSHGSHMNHFVRSSDEVDWPAIEAMCRKWLGERYYGAWGGEWLYSRIPPRLLVEPFIGELAGLPIDYKLWTFHGRVEFIQVDTDRETSHKRTMFDRNWKRLPFTVACPIDEKRINPPGALARMIEAAETLSERSPFVRVDLYEINGAPRFGEMTYYPGSGWEPFKPAEYDREIGKLY